MAEKISASKGFDDTTFDTYVPELQDPADIRNALELFFYGNSEDGNATGDVSLHATLVDFDTRIDANDAAFDGHTGAISDVHGIGAGNLVVGTGTVQTLTNKTLTSPVITGGTVNGGAALTVDSTELNYVDGVTSSIQTQINTNTPTGMISIHSGSVAPTGWLLCDGSTYSTTTYANLFAVVGYTFGGTLGSFAVPNLKGRVVVGIDAAQTEFDTRGEAGGAMTHFHSSSNSGNTIPTTSGASDGNTTNGSSSANSGGANAGNNTSGHTFNAGLDATTSNNSANHTHSVNPGETATTSDGSHNHTTTNAANNINAGVYATVMDNVSAGSHSHNVNIATLDSGNQSANHTHTVDDHYHTTTDHSHTIAHTHTTSDHTHTAAHSHTTPASDIISNLQPYIALNYIIKI
jgi:microcystin-dependent protein